MVEVKAMYALIRLFTLLLRLRLLMVVTHMLLTIVKPDLASWGLSSNVRILLLQRGSHLLLIRLYLRMEVLHCELLLKLLGLVILHLNFLIS